VTVDVATFALLADAAALVAERGDAPVGVVAKLDFLEFLSHRSRD